MIRNWSNIRIFIKPGVTDMRKQINGLSVIVQEQLKSDPFSGNLYMFCNRTKKLLKILYWDRNGFCLWQKRVEEGRFPWPKNQHEAIEIRQEQLTMILDGIDFWNAHKKLSYSSVF